MGPVSMVIGGIMFSLFSLVLSLVARSRVNQMSEWELPEVLEIQLAGMKRNVKMAVIISLIAIGINVVSLILVFPAMLEIIQSDNFVNIFNDGTGITAETGSSAW